MRRVALAVIHGVGRQGKNYADAFLKRIRKRFAARLRDVSGDPQDRLATNAILLSSVLGPSEIELLIKTRLQHLLGWKSVRDLMVNYVGDAIGYQRTERKDSYGKMHVEVARGLGALEDAAGADACLAIAAHSLGTVIISNYIWDLERDVVPGDVKEAMKTSTARLENLAHLYTMGSPLALWTLRFPDFGQAIRFPVPAHPPVASCEWVNFFDDDDVIAYPLRDLSRSYEKAVTRDREVTAGGWLTRWNPLSHGEYWTSPQVIRAIADRLAEDWRVLNG